MRPGWLVILVLMGVPCAAQPATYSFTKHILTNEFISEGVAVGDVNRDGRPDILAGAYWFEAPSWRRHEIVKGQHYEPATGFSNSFLNFCLDVNQDGWVDLIRISLPGEEAVWYENRDGKTGPWPMHMILGTLGNESPAFVDIDGDGRKDLLCNDPSRKEMIWLKSPSVKGDIVWRRTVIDKGDIPGVDRYTHGLGWADMNGDGRKDVVITKGWWESPPDPGQANWVFHPADLGEDCSQIYAMDMQGNARTGAGKKAGNDDMKAGGRDLLSASAHRYGIWWHEQTKDGQGHTIWKHHTIFSGFSQSHGMAMADINGDGYADLVTGKRYFAHNEKDPGALDPAVLYWLEFKPGKEPSWIPHLIDDQSGVGLQVLAQDINGDGAMDIIVANKKGVFFFQGKRAGH